MPALRYFFWDGRTEYQQGYPFPILVQREVNISTPATIRESCNFPANWKLYFYNGKGFVADVGEDEAPPTSYNNNSYCDERELFVMVQKTS